MEELYCRSATRLLTIGIEAVYKRRYGKRNDKTKNTTY